MPLSEKEVQQLNALKIKEAESLTDADLEEMDRNVDSLFEYQEAFKALMIWNRFSDQLSTLASNNSLLIREVRRLRSEVSITHPIEDKEL